MPIDVVCPTCNTVSRLEGVERDASSFCQTCDFPLFWAQPSRSASVASRTEGWGLRRLPGTEGWAIAERLTCPECSEPNLQTEDLCVRCGADLHPRPPARQLPPPPPPPAPGPVAARRRWRWWPVTVAAAVVLAGLVAWALVQYLA